MGAMSKAGYDNSLGLIAKRLRDEWSELVAAPLPERLRRLVDQLQNVESLRVRPSCEALYAAHSDKQPVTQITVIESEPERQTEALSLMIERARFMARQPGFISISVHRSLDGRRIVNYVQWQTRELLQSAHKAPEFRKEWGHFDQLTDAIDRHLYEVTHVMDST
jgi:heme-degrading monooxygenase HmoA